MWAQGCLGHEVSAYMDPLESIDMDLTLLTGSSEFLVVAVEQQGHFSG
jgi:hypothetical protein